MIRIVIPRSFRYSAAEAFRPSASTPALTAMSTSESALRERQPPRASADSSSAAATTVPPLQSFMLRILVRTSGGPAFLMHTCEGRRMRLDLSHCIAVVDLLTAGWTRVVFQVGHSISLTLVDPSPATANSFDPFAAAGRTRLDLERCHLSLAPGLAWMNNVQILSGTCPART